MDVGRFRWVYCLLDILRRCFPASVLSILEHLPETLDETYEHTLLRIDKVKQEFAHRLFQCIAVSVRPLRVEELAEILAVRFDAGALPQFNTRWRLGDAEEAVLSACSSLITVVNVNGSRIVQFAHFSVQEFLTSDRLSTARQDLSRYHIVPHLAHATLAQACLGVLLQLDDGIDKGSIMTFPLSDYAAQHWFEHGQFEDVSLVIQDATGRLFDRKRPHFSAWVWIYDIDDPWRESMPTKHPEQPMAPPLYYAIQCRFRWLIDHLIATYPEDIVANGGYCCTSWIAAFNIGDTDLALSLLRCGANVHALDVMGSNPIHRASGGGHTDIVWLLLEHDADVDLKTTTHVTPLAFAASFGQVATSRLLIQEGADVNSRTAEGETPLYRASQSGHLEVVRLLVDNGAHLDVSAYRGWTPLHSAARNGHLDTVKYLLESGTNVNTLSDDRKTPLDLAFDNGKPEVASFLSRFTADPIPSDCMVNQSSTHLQLSNERTVRLSQEPDFRGTPLSAASVNGQLDIVRSLLDKGSDVNETDGHRVTPLHLTSTSVEVAKLLIERGAYVNARTKRGRTPLHSTIRYGNLEVVRLLLDHGANVNARARDDETPLHEVSQMGCLHITRLLVERGADVDVRDANGRTPRQVAMALGNHRIAEFLLERST